MTAPTTIPGQLSDRVALELKAEAEAVTQRIKWLTRDTATALRTAGVQPQLLAQLDEATNYALAALAGVRLTIQEATE